jgi:hypothetical protein
MLDVASRSRTSRLPQIEEHRALNGGMVSVDIAPAQLKSAIRVNIVQ